MKTLREKENLPITSIFSFFQSVSKAIFLKVFKSVGCVTMGEVSVALI